MSEISIPYGMVQGTRNSKHRFKVPSEKDKYGTKFFILSWAQPMEQSSMRV